MKCLINLDVEKSTVLKSLSDYCGSNKTLLYQIATLVTEGQNEDGTYIPSSDFSKWYKKKYKSEVNLNSDDADKVREAVVEYYKETVPSVHDSIRDTKIATVIATYGYSSASAREDAKQVVTSIMFKAHVDSLFQRFDKDEDGIKDRYLRARMIANKIIENSKLSTEEKNIVKKAILNSTSEEAVRAHLSGHNLKANFDVYGKNVDYYKLLAKAKINTQLVSRIAVQTGESEQVIKQRIKEEKVAYIENALGGQYMSLNDQNLVALYKELNYNTDNFYTELLLNSKLDFLRNDRKDELDDENEKEAVDAAADEEGEGNVDEETPLDDDTDITIAMYDHSGTYTSAMTHVNKDIKAYLDSLPLLNSNEKINGELDYNLDNALGLPVTMDSNKCATVLYHYCNTSDVDSFIESIKDIANSLPGFAGFNVLADFLTNNRTAAFAFYTTFGKKVISKVQVQEEDGIRSLEITNKKSNKIDAFRQELFNAVRTSIPKQDVDYNTELVDSVSSYVKTNAGFIVKNPNGKFAKKAIAKIAEVLKHYYTNIDEYSIANYVYKHKNNKNFVDYIENLNSLINTARNTVKASTGSQSEYTAMLSRMSEARKTNKELVTKKNEMAAAGLDTSNLPEKIDVESIYTRDYITDEQKRVAIELSNQLVDYALIKVENNSLNPLGNQSSDVINSSFITGMMQVLQDRATLEQYGTFKFQSQQYNFSNIMLEHIEKDGTTIYGLFRKNADGSVTPTEYASELLQIFLYNGAKNYDEEKGITYPQHSKGDYLASQFVAFRNPGKTSTTSNIQFGGYFMRTPSDAPKNFIIYAPKYSGKGLFSVTNKEAVNSRRKELRQRITDKTFVGDVSKIASNRNAVKTSRIDSVINHLTKDNLRIKLPKWILDQHKEGEEVIIKFQYTSQESKQDQNIYAVKGTIENGYLTNGELVHVYNNDLSIDVESELDFAIEKQLQKEGVISRKINTNHILIKQLRNIFKQELLDMAVAIDKFFVTKDGLVTRDTDGNIIWKEGISHNGREVNGAYDNYHHKNGVIVEGEVGQERLVGNVFHSDRFTVYNEDNSVVRNYGEELIQEMFNPLYGGADGSYIHTITNNDGKVVDVTLTPEQETAINEKLSEYVQHLIDDAMKRLEGFEHIIGEKELTVDNVAEFVINYQIAYSNFNDLFEGDSKFYKDAQTFLKRAKEIQGSGVPYGIANFAKTFTTSRKVIPSPLASTIFYGNHKVKQYNKFVGVTVVNTVTQNEDTLKLLVNKLVEIGVSREQAQKLIDGFRNVTINDAQSYITFDEWIRRITARGQLNKYKPLINKVLSGKELNGAELSEFIQVQKNFYYDQNYDNSSNIFAPRQIKNAEFVLVPQLIAGTQLEVVAKLMDKYGIDQLNTEETSKAGKTNTLSIFDAKTGEVHQDIIDEINGKGISSFGQSMSETGRGKQLYGYEFLYTQQETPQHLDAENKAGIQIMKKIIDNINPEDGEIYQYKQKFIECYTANIRESAQNLFKELDLELDKSGNPKTTTNSRGETVIKGLKYSVFYDKLKAELFRLGYDSNMIDYVTLDAVRPDSNGNVTLMPNYMSMVGQKLESIAQSVFNNSITRQKLPGFHAAQITNVGFKATKDKVSYSNELRYHTDEKGNYVDYIEIMLPASAFHFKRRNANGTLKTKEELLKELQEEGLDIVIGYRIPTEGKQSVCKMKVVGFIDDAYGSTIVVPNEWVAQTGSDFDIDSVYGIQHSTYVGEDGKIKKHKYNQDDTPEQNTRDARNNEILDSMLAILSDEKNLEEILSRSNFEDISHKADGNDPGGALQQVAPKTFMNRRNGRSVYNVLDQADYQEDTMSGARLKGFSVTRDNFCSVCNTVHPTINSNYSIDVTYSPDIISFEEAVKRFGKENVRRNGSNIVITHNKIGWTLDNKNVVSKILTAYSSQTTAHILDAVKEGSIPNVNDFTFGVYKLFPDLGIDYKTAIAFMMQNGVKRIVDAYNNSKSVFITDTQKPIDQAIRGIARELGYQIEDWTSVKSILEMINRDYKATIKKILGVNFVSLSDEETGKIAVSSSRLIDQLNSPVKGIEGLIFDLGTILQYNKFKHLADEIGNLARVCNPDKFGAKQSIFATNKVFDDIQRILDSNKEQALKVGDKSFLEAIYPGISKGLESYLKDTNNDSAYPILHTFLKYSTAPSIIINRSLFRTQSEEFRTFVTKLEDYLSNGQRLTEAQYKSFEKYLISELYNQCDRLVLPITFNKRASRNVWVSPVPENVTDEELQIYKDEERSRIFGYRTTPEPTMIITNEKGEEEVVPFEIKDLAHPTQEEINNFARLTPAQKVAFIQENFRDAGIFGALSVNLFNVRDISGKKAGSQTIEFIEDTISKEDAYIQFVEAFTNRNPLVALTAYDLIKYAFIVEGYKISKRGISKIIPNSVLRGDFDSNGTGLVTELNGKFINLENALLTRTSNAHVDYVRSHSKTLNIPFKYVTKTSKSGFELKRNAEKIILIPNTEENKELLGKYKITYVKGDDTYFNSFIRLKFGKEDEILYRIVLVNGSYLLHPVNLLEENEHGEFSSNSANNRFPSQRYYQKIIDDLKKSEVTNESLSIISSNYKSEDYRRKINKDKENKFETIDFSMDNPNPSDIGMVDHIKKEVQNFYKTKTNRDKVLFMRDRGLERHIKKYGEAAGLIQYIDVEHGTAEEHNVETIPFLIYRLPSSIIKKSIQPYLKDTTKNLSESHKKYTYIIEKLRSEGVVDATVVPIFALKPDPTKNSTLRSSRLTEGRNATATDVAGDIFKSVNRVIAADMADAETVRVRQYWRDKGITSNISSIEQNLFEVIRSGSEYITKRVESITNQLKYFIEDPHGDGYLSVNSPGVIEIIYKNPVLRNKFLQLIEEAEAIVTNNMAILELDIKAQDDGLQTYLNKIKAKLQELQNSNLIAEAQTAFANQYLSAYSTDPLIKRDLLNVINGFYSTNWLESWIGDLQETPNPMIQIIAKEVTSDLFAKQKLAHIRVRDFESRIKDIATRASAKGMDVNWKHIVDENGILIQNYTQQLIKDMRALSEKATAARKAYKNGTGDYRTYLEAKLEYDKWKLEHINQELEDDYYRRKIALDEAMLHGVKPTADEIKLGADPNGTSGYPDVFIRYKELEARRRELYSHTVNGYLDPYYLEELDKVSKEISNLIDASYVDPITGTVQYMREEYDPFFNPLTGTEEEKRIKRMYSGPSQRALKKYLEDVKKLNEDYFQKDTEFGFDEELAKNINIINSYEQRDANGNITVPMNLLMEHPEYVAAKEWVTHNAKFIMNDEHRDELNKAFEKLRKKTSRVILKHIVEKYKAKDVYGNIDAREFTENDIERIKTEQVGDQNYHDGTSFSDRSLIRNATASTIIYKREFYKGLTTNGISNADWFEKINEINSILERYWDNEHKQVRLDWIPDTEEGRETLIKLGRLYDELQGIKRKEGVSKEEVETIIKFREENVDSSLTAEEQAIFDAQQTAAQGKTQAYKQAWNAANYLIIDGERVINPYLYGSLHPKAEVADKWIDKEKTDAVNLINKTYISTPTEYYYQKVAEMSKLGKEAFDKWYYDNHIWNPSTRSYEPLRCWTTYTYRDLSLKNGKWVPQWINTRSKVREERKNKNYIPNVGHAMNYKIGTNYDNPQVSEQNEFEKELKIYVQDLLYSLVHTDSGLRYLNNGYLPSQPKAPDTTAKSVGKEFLKSLGWVSYHTGKENFHDDIGYDTDKTIEMPLLTLLNQRKPEQLGLIKPVKNEGESDEDFAKREAKYEEDIKKLNEENAKAHRDALNQDWESVIKSFILQASHFNAIQDNKYMLFYGKRMLEKLETYITKYGGTSDFKKDGINSTEENPEYKSRKEKHISQQYENWVRRLVYDEWKEPRNKLTKWASRLQSLTSAQYMMMNVRGGIANVTLGETQIIAEAFAKEYFGSKSWAKGVGLWNSSIISQFARMDSETSISLADAIIKWFNVVDYDENVGKSKIVENSTMKGFNKFNRAMYSPQTIGENFMQNSALFAMLYDHHVFIEVDPVTNEQTVKFKNINEYTRDLDVQALKAILSDELKQKLDNIEANTKLDANKLKDYAWFKKDFITDFAEMYLTDELRDKYIKERKNRIKAAKQAFNEAPTLMDQLELGSDGFMTIKKDSILSKFNTTDENNPVSKALKLLADFRNRVISVNKKIHGFYDKLSQAQLEKKWYGSLVMQYHKHIYPGMMKRWRVKGIYNEQRGTIEKGSYISLLHFLGTPIRKANINKSLSEGEISALESIQNIFKEMFNFCIHVNTHWNLLPDYEKSNIRRNLGDLLGVASAILLVMALRAAGDDDNKESIWYNLALYEADRLASESFQFNPIGMINEAKKLWSTPIAAQSGLEDLISTMGFISDWLFDEDFDPYYQSGRFAGQNKFIVRLKRRIPIYRGINTSFLEITESNHYYKMGQNMLNSKIVENMIEWVDDDED